jgi:uncharacterized phage-associated protein
MYKNDLLCHNNKSFRVHERRIIMKAIEIAQWFIRNNYDNPRNTFDGNMKIQKLLYFAQLIHLVRHEQPLFEDDIFAFENGSVVENVRIAYRNSTNFLIEDAYTKTYDFDSEHLSTLKIVEDIFGNLSARELSDLNHLHDSWKESYENSCYSPSFRNKLESKMELENLKANDLDKIKEMITAYEANSTDSENHCFEVINGIKFYYDPTEINIDSELISLLSTFEGEDDTYTLYKDSKHGVVIY